MAGTGYTSYGGPGSMNLRNAQGIIAFSTSTSNMMTLSGSQVGIGSTTPLERLDINGTNPRIFLDDSTAPGTTTNRLYAVSGQLYWNGVGLTSAGSLPSPVEGNVMRGNGTTSWQTTDSLYIASSSGYVGIGTTNPIEKLHINAGDGDSVFLQITNDDTGTADNNGLYVGLTSADEGYVGTRSNNNLIFETNDAHAITIDTSQQVGIGTTNPAEALDVNGNIETQGDLYFQNSAVSIDRNSNALRLRSYDGWQFYDTQGSSELIRITQAGNVGIGTTSPGFLAHIYGSDNTVAKFESTDDTAAIWIRDNDTSTYVGSKDTMTFIGQTGTLATTNIQINSLGYVGIGTTNPTVPLHVYSTSHVQPYFETTGASTDINMRLINPTQG